MIDALLVGSRARWRTKLDPVLADYGIRVRWWWETRSDTGAIPTGCDVVLVATDCNAHTVSEPALRRARDAGIPVHTIVHRKAALVPMLRSAGFTPSQMPPIPPIPMTAPTSTLHTPEPILMPSPAVIDPEPEILQAYLINPWLTAREVSEIFGVAISVAQRQSKAAREVAGIQASSGSGSARIVDRARYEAVCHEHKIVPITEDAGPIRASGLNAVKPEAAEAIPAPITPPQAATPQGDLPDVMAALALLREAMLRENVESITLTGSTATLTRRVIITETIPL